LSGIELSMEEAIQSRKEAIMEDQVHGAFAQSSRSELEKLTGGLIVVASQRTG